MTVTRRIMNAPLQEAIFEHSLARWLIAIAFLCRGTLWLLLRQSYRGISDFCWIARVSRVEPLRRIALRVVFRAVQAQRAEATPLVESYRAHPHSASCASLYSISGRGSLDLFRDLIVLKKATVDEKGVILLKYDRTFDAVVSLFDLPRLMGRYVFVLEPSWSGYCAPSILMFLTAVDPVVVQCFTEDDHRFISDVGRPFIPVWLGPADWVNADLFGTVHAESKKYDLVMVANWARHKRHAVLFHALSRIRDRHIRVLLVGFPWAGRTAADIRREVAAIRNDLVQVDILENLPQPALAARLAECKAFVFLSRKEGDNKSLVEAMFADVPGIVYDRTIGGASRRINPATGVFASDDELADKIRYMLDHHAEFTPRTWIREHSGSAVATRILDEAIRHAVSETGGKYTRGIVEKTNSPNLTYTDPACREAFRTDYQFILSCRRQNTFGHASHMATWMHVATPHSDGEARRG